ncbi:YdiU family protein [Lacinutrix sp. C3R15]|uniref:protein adenylyltransferase SelO n=1 Tax=Flavobacteriaceae TaxID=49546 RepID=UPI001C0A1C03|nr:MULTISPECIES: YdiU family protein [Flavobacteriaceae]MBU2940561.1 YdiU family protein [Lacinutrix sp. C3R15]MDO6623880.1 YdiU family protein [Oceanihabitans sp. 1_MG-2023]
MKLNIKDRFNKELPADPILVHSRRQVEKACFSYATPKKTAKPKLLHVSPEMLDALGLTAEDAKSKTFLQVFTGNAILPDTKPYAMCYGGHQFGNWAGQLGDGRAINLAEIEHRNKHWSIQLKGAGETPYSRTADGLAVLRSSVREYLCSEAMYHLGVPTTRALSLALSGDEVWRDMLYDGNPAYEKGAIVSRVAPSFLRFGNYQILAARQDSKTLKTLVDYTIKHHFSHLGNPSKETYLKFFESVLNNTLEMLIHWQRVGFVHGVMNTDNMSILGLTIDYGPYGWLEGYDPNWTPNTTDRQYKRYAFGAQLEIGLWNLLQLANALYPLIEEAEGLENILNTYNEKAAEQYITMMRSKLGLLLEDEKDVALIFTLEEILKLSETDMTIFFRNLSNFSAENPSEGLQIIEEAFYVPTEISEVIKEKWNTWFTDYAARLQQESISDQERKQKMNLVNPKYVLRNYMAQLAIDDANKGDYKQIDVLFKLLKKPYDEQPENEKWFAKRPEWARHKAGCSMLSCSS